MSILDKMKVETTRRNLRRPEDPHGVELEYHSREDHAVPAVFNGYTYENGFVTELRLRTLWFANQAQFSIRKEMAEKEILYYIYGPILHRFNELRARSADRDWREVHRILDEIEKELVG